MATEKLHPNGKHLVQLGLETDNLSVLTAKTALRAEGWAHLFECCTMLVSPFQREAETAD